MPVHQPMSIMPPAKTVRVRLEKADINGDGRLSVKELKKLFKEMGSNWPGVRTWLCMRNADGDGDGEISASEMDNLVAYILNWTGA
ncbi:hypothetical protein QN277_009588 [Acacia crassicarpa]|uniref:EF-hand domain-containing protein n=1 Tax=Acacia crassicarpa TaxID=499986 RepID=A0AAE1IRC7_9FABA|nr:hypothetical protein QN277_009588 [Acacia crassicarpa]